MGPTPTPRGLGPGVSVYGAPFLLLSGSNSPSSKQPSLLGTGKGTSPFWPVGPSRQLAHSFLFMGKDLTLSRLKDLQVFD